jgi:hypothetical protein
MSATSCFQIVEKAKQVTATRADNAVQKANQTVETALPRPP